MEMPNNVPARHVLVFPFPLQGHLNCMLNLAKMLVLISEFHVTLLLTDYNLSRLRNNPSSSSSSISDIPRLRLLSIPDGLPENHPRQVDGLLELMGSLETRATAVFKSLLLGLCKKDVVNADGFPVVTCVIADGILPFMIGASEEIGVPAIAFRTASALSFWAYYCVPRLLQCGELPFRDGVDWDEPIKGIPGMQSFLRRRDLPSSCREKDPENKMLQLLAKFTIHSKSTRGLILHTSDTLEAFSLEQIHSEIPVTYAIGPLHEMVRSSHSEVDTHEHDESAMISLWNQDGTCMTWLDVQPHQSVVYVSYGSLTVMSQQDLVEFWIGLVNSGERFLWVVRSDLQLGGTEWTEIRDSLPIEVREGTDERGCIVSWAPQVQVLAHPAVGCFLTHAGWNSVLESVVQGVPMICWPYFADQQINSRIISEVWRIGLDRKDVCDRTTVENMVRAAMKGEIADGMRREARCLAKTVRSSVVEGGSSYQNFQRLIQYIKSL